MPVPRRKPRDFERRCRHKKQLWAVVGVNTKKVLEPLTSFKNFRKSHTHTVLQVHVLGTPALAGRLADSSYACHPEQLKPPTIQQVVPQRKPTLLVHAPYLRPQEPERELQKCGESPAHPKSIVSFLSHSRVFREEG